MVNAANEPSQGRRILCAHADQDGEGSHWLEPGEKCAQAISATRIQEAAYKVEEELALLVGRLADELLGRPEFGSPEWVAEHEARNTPEGQAKLLAWHMTKIRICRAAKVDPTGDVLNAKRLGATWEQIGQVCETTRQAAYDRWAKFVKAFAKASESM